MLITKDTVNIKGMNYKKSIVYSKTRRPELSWDQSMITLT